MMGMAGTGMEGVRRMRNVGWPLPKGKRKEARKKGVLEQAETLELVLVDVVTFSLGRRE